MHHENASLTSENDPNMRLLLVGMWQPQQRIGSADVMNRIYSMYL